MTSLSQGDKDRIRKQHINSPKFDPAFIGEGGPINLVQSCGFVNNKYRKGFDEIKWNFNKETT